MALFREQIESGKLKGISGRKSRKWMKNQTARLHRRKMKSSVEYVPQYNRYKGWEL